MNVEFGTEAAQFPEKENINGIFVAMRSLRAEKLQCTGKSINTWDRDRLKDCPDREERTGHTSKGITATVETEEFTLLIFYTGRNIYKCEEKSIVRKVNAGKSSVEIHCYKSEHQKYEISTPAAG